MFAKIGGGVFLLLSLVFGQTGSEFQLFIDQVNSAPDSLSKASVIDSFYTYARTVGIPFIDGDSTACFFYRHETADSIGVEVYNFADYFMMTRLPQTDFWYVCKDFGRNARLQYTMFTYTNSSILPSFFVDPENPEISEHCFSLSPVSILRMPDNRIPTELEYNPDVAHGTITDTIILHCDSSNEDYAVQLYLPPSYFEDSLRRYPVAYSNDGDKAMDTSEGGGRSINALDNLIALDTIVELINVYIHTPEDRAGHFSGSSRFAYESFVINVLVPYVDSVYRTIPDPQHRGMSGSSLGGPITCQIVYSNPEIFGNATLISPSGKDASDDYYPAYKEIMKGPKKEIKWYIEYGIYESESAIPFKIGLIDTITKLGYEIESRKWWEGHVVCSFAEHQFYPLRYFYGTDTSPIKHDVFSYSGKSYLPNYTVTLSGQRIKISFPSPVKENLVFELYNSIGRSIYSSTIKMNTTVFELYRSVLSKGMYFIRIKGTGKRFSDRIILK